MKKAKKFSAAPRFEPAGGVAVTDPGFHVQDFMLGRAEKKSESKKKKKGCLFKNLKFGKNLIFSGYFFKIFIIKFTNLLYILSTF